MSGATVNQPQSDNIGLTVGPIFTNKSGQVYRLESFINTKLAEANINIDLIWGLSSQPHEDPGDERLLFYPGRLLLPMERSLRTSIWKTSSLLSKTCQVGPVQAVKTTDMVAVEDMDDMALPASSISETHMSQADKHQQIGVDACVRCPRGTLDGVVLTGDPICVDVFPQIGDFVKACMTFQQEFTSKIKVVSYAQSDSHQEWLAQEVRNWYTQNFLSSKLKIKGTKRLSQDMPKEMLETQMTTPDLKDCTWAKDKHGTPFASLPQVHKEKYGDHPDNEIKGKFAELAKKFNLAVHPGGEPSDVEPPFKKHRLFVNFKMASTTKDENTKEGTPT